MAVRAEQSAHHARGCVLSTGDLALLTNELESVTDWYNLGIKLSLPPHTLHTISQDHPLDTKRCKTEMLTKWLYRGENCTWRAIVVALRQIGMGALANQIQRTTPDLSSRTRCSLTAKNEATIKSKFYSLVSYTRARLQKHLRERRFEIKDFYLTVIGIFSPAGDCIPECFNLFRIFAAITRNQLWDYWNYHPLESIIELYCRDDAVMNSKIEEYKKDLCAFQATTKIIEWMQSHNHKLIDISDHEVEQSDPPVRTPARCDPQYYRKLQIALDLRNTEHTLTYIDRLWRSLTSLCPLPDLPALLDKIRSGSIIISWLVPKSAVSVLIERGRQCTKFFREHQIVRVDVDGVCIYQSDDSATEQMITVKERLEHAQEELAHASEAASQAEQALKQWELEVERLETELQSQEVEGNQLEHHQQQPLESEQTTHTSLRASLQAKEVKAMDQFLLEKVSSARVQGELSALCGRLEKIHNEVEGLSRELATLGVEKDEGSGRGEVGEQRRQCQQLEAGLQAAQQQSRELELQFQRVEERERLAERVRAMTYKHRKDLSEIVHQKLSRRSLPMSSLDREEPKDTRETAITSKLDSSDQSIHSNARFLEVCEAGNFKEALNLLSKGANPKARNKTGQTALHYACQNGNLGFVKTLIEELHGDKECKDDDGETPLHWACRNRCVEVVHYLILVQHCNPQCTDNSGWTPLHYACRWGYLEIVQCLFSDQRCDPQCMDKVGMTPLHLACNKNHVNVAKFLLSEGVDPNCSTKDGHTPLSLTRNTNIIRELLLRGVNPRTIYHEQIHGDLLREVSVPPPESAVKMFVVGAVDAGKSSLTAALKKESKGLSRLASRFTQVSGVEQRTAGIIPHEFTSQTLGRVNLYDFAGHKEFHASHDAILRSTMAASSAAVFLLVAALAGSDEEFRNAVVYWLNFIDNQFTSSSTKPHIILIGSHADAVSSKVLKDKKAIISSLASSYAFSSFHFTGFVAMDCRYSVSTSMSELHKRLAEACKSLRDSTQIDLQSHLFLVYLLDKFRHLPAASLGEILSYIQQHSGEDESDTNLVISRRMPNTVSSLYKACEELNTRGSLLFLGNMETPKNSWLVLDRKAILSDVTGSIFAPESFKQHCKLASSTGVVSLSNIATHFPTLHPNMITCLLSHLDFCHEITDHIVLELLQSSSSSAQEKYYFFPALITIDTPPEVWKDSSKFSCHSAWQLRCSGAEQFFTPRFLSVLLLRLAIRFALAPDTEEVSSDLLALQRKCSVWKNGIYWRNRQGVEALVEVGKDSQSTTVMVHSQEGCEMACIHLRSALLQVVLKTHKQYCPKVTTSELFIHPDDASSYPLQLEHGPCTITDITRAIVEGTPFIVGENESALEIDTLLHFEPYAHLGEASLVKMFIEAHPDYTEPADAEVIERITYNVKLKLGESPGVFSTPADILHNVISRSPNITYRDLRAVLDQFSVFAGRNPLELSGQLSPVPTDATETQAKGHHLTSVQGDHFTPAHTDVSADIPKKTDKPRLYELQRLRGREGSVIRVIRDVAVRWDDLAIALQFQNEIAEIRVNTHHQAENACAEMFHRWLSEDPEEHQYRTPVTWDTLLEALRDCEFTVLARDLENALN